MDANILQIHLPDALRDFVRSEVELGSFKSPEDFVTSLVAAEQKRRMNEELEELAEEGIASGPLVEANAEFWEQRRRRIIERFGTG